MPYHIVRLKKDTLVSNLIGLLQSEKVVLGCNLDAPASLVLEASRSNWNETGPQGCILQSMQIVATMEDDPTSATGKKMERCRGSFIAHRLDCMCGPASPKLLAGTKILVCDFLS